MWPHNAYKLLNNIFPTTLVRRCIHSKTLDRLSKSETSILKHEIRGYFQEQGYSYGLSPVRALFFPWVFGSPAKVEKTIDYLKERNEIIFEENFSGHQHSKWGFGLIKNDMTPTTLSLPLIFTKGILSLKEFVNHSTLQEDSVPAFKALARFFREKDRHQTSLQTLLKENKNLKEAHVAAILVNHLLSQFLPRPSNHFLDMQNPKMDGCPCGDSECRDNTNYGKTLIGSPQLFSGPVDLAMFSYEDRIFDIDGASLFTIRTELDKRCQDDGYNLVEPDDISLSFSDEEEDEDSRLNSKLLSDVSVSEFKNLQRDIFTATEYFNQICKQAISAALCRKSKRVKTCSNDRPLFVPVVGLTSTTFDMVLYDPESDILLKSYKPGELFESDGSLASIAVINLWLAVHHHIFASKLPSDILNNYKSTLQKDIIPIDYFDEIVASSSMVCQFESRRTPIHTRDTSTLNPNEFGQEKVKELLSDAND